VSHLWSVLSRHRDYRFLLSAGLVSMTGDWILNVGLVYYVYALTGSTLASGTVLLAAIAPQVLIGSIAGVYVDRWDRRRTMIAANVLLAVVLLPLLAVNDASRLWIVYPVVVLSTCVEQFFYPAEQALVPHLVDEGDLITANALNGQNRTSPGSSVRRSVGSRHMPVGSRWSPPSTPPPSWWPRACWR
jgi:Na+/melibiose symporter-like transporter